MIYYYVIKTSYFVRLYGDDYCTSAMLKKFGYWQSQLNWYGTWSGRFTYNLFVHFSELLGIGFTKVLPVILLTSLILSFTFALYGFYRKSYMSCLVISSIVMSLIVFNSPNIYQTLYWQTGSLTYLIPFIFLNLIIALIGKYYNSLSRLDAKVILLLLLLSFLSGGFSESYVVLQTCILSCFLLLSIAKNKIKNNINLYLLTVPLVGSIISMFIVAIAPGNKIRQSLLPESQNIFIVVRDTLCGTMKYLYSFYSNPIYTMSFFVVLFIGLYFTSRLYQSIRINIRVAFVLVLAVSVVVILSIASIYAPGIYALSEFPPSRTLSMAAYVMIISAFIIGSIIGSLLNNYLNKTLSLKFNTLWSGVIVLISVILFPLIVETNRVVYGNIKNYSISWDIQEKEINDQLNIGSKNLEIIWINPIGDLPDMQPSSNGWVNGCMSDYFGVDTITGIKK